MSVQPTEQHQASVADDGQNAIPQHEEAYAIPESVQATLVTVGESFENAVSAISQNDYVQNTDRFFNSVNEKIMKFFGVGQEPAIQEFDIIP